MRISILELFFTFLSFCLVNVTMLHSRNLVQSFKTLSNFYSFISGIFVVITKWERIAGNDSVYIQIC